MAGIPFVFTIARVAEMLGENEEWLREISINMDPEEGSLWVLGVGDDQYPAFTEYGIECLKQIIIEERALAARNPEQDRWHLLRCSPDAYKIQAMGLDEAIAGLRGKQRRSGPVMA